MNDMRLSISDDDLCATCGWLEYSPGERSYCGRHFPGHFDEDGYCDECSAYSEIEKQGENWAPEALWDALGNVPVDDDGILQEPFLELFPAGTDREFIWRWFERAFNISVHDLMFGEED